MTLRFVFAAALGTLGAAQAPYQGNGIGQAFLAHGPARIGATVDFECGSPAAPSGIAILAISDGLTPSTHPLVTGPIGLDLGSAGFQSQAFVLDAAGEVFPSGPIPNLPALAQLPPVFALVAVFEGGQISLSKTTRVIWDNPGAWSPAGALLTGRAAHTATALGGSPRDPETRVLITGGGGGTILVPQATDSTELWSPLERTTTAGPTMAFARALHQAVRLDDGRVLVCGGADPAGNVTAHAEIYDPVTNAWTATAAMGQPRVGHQATRLGDGRVLVTGGLSNYTNPLTNLAAVLNTAQATGELFDPATGLWTAVPGAMNSPRTGHQQTLLPDGRVLITAGISGGAVTPIGQVPIYTATCAVYDPVANALSATGSLGTARAFHGASVLPGGEVLATGGSVLSLILGLVLATDTCERWNGSTWGAAGPLPTGLTNHVQVRAPDGRALVVGGLAGAFPNFVGSAVAGHHDGTAFAAGLDLGLNPGRPGAVPAPRGAAASVWLFDGTLALFGGTDGAMALPEVFVHTP